MTDLSWETLATETDYSCPGFDVTLDHVRLPDGTRDEFHYVDEPESVVIIPFTSDGDVVVIEEWRQAVGRQTRGFPAGNVDPDDGDLAAAAHRELVEETGYHPDEMEYLGAFEPANGFANSVNHFFVGHDCIANGEQTLDDNESIEPAETTLERLRERLEKGELRDGRTALGLLYYEFLDT